MKGCEAIADALCRYTDRRYTVPGFPITGLGRLTEAEMVINEKTALEYALGDSLSGRRAAVIIKNVGINACADPLLQAVTQGLVSGVVLVAGDDPDAVASQTAQDSRYYGELAELPVIEPDATTCYTGVESALQASEMFSRIAILRLTPRLLDARADHNPVPRMDGRGRLSDRAWTMNGRVTAAEELYRAMFSWADSLSFEHMGRRTFRVGAAPGKTRIITVYPVPDQTAALQCRAGIWQDICQQSPGTAATDPAETPPVHGGPGILPNILQGMPVQTCDEYPEGQGCESNLRCGLFGPCNEPAL